MHLKSTSRKMIFKCLIVNLSLIYLIFNTTKMPSRVLYLTSTKLPWLLPPSAGHLWQPQSKTYFLVKFLTTICDNLNLNQSWLLPLMANSNNYLRSPPLQANSSNLQRLTLATITTNSSDDQPQTINFDTIILNF